MFRFLGLLLAAAALSAGVVGVAVWSVATATDAYALFQFEREDPASMETRRGIVHGAAGIGPLRRDVVAIEGSPTTTRVYRVGDPPSPWPSPEFLVGEHGARYVSESPHEGAWSPFAIAAGAGFLVAGLGAWFAPRLATGAIRNGGFVVFGQRDPNVQNFGWLPGSGTHGGGGGQVPPHVPYNFDWHPKKRIH